MLCVGNQELEQAETSTLDRGTQRASFGGRRAPAEEKVVEDLVTVPINDDGSWFFLIGSTIEDTEREKLI